MQRPRWLTTDLLFIVIGVTLTCLGIMRRDVEDLIIGPVLIIAYFGTCTRAWLLEPVCIAIFFGIATGFGMHRLIMGRLNWWGIATLLLYAAGTILFASWLHAVWRHWRGLPWRNWWIRRILWIAHARRMIRRRDRR